MRQRLITALPDLLQRFADTRGDNRMLVVAESGSLTAAEMDAAAWRGTEQLRDMGARAGSVIALHGEPGPAWLAALCACWRLGAVAAPLNHRQPEAERQRIADVLECEFHWTPHTTDLLAPARTVNSKRVDWPLQQAMLRVCTSGSTGTPRCVELTLEQLWFNTLGSNRRLGHRKNDRWLVCLPVNHVGALAAIFRSLHNRIALELDPVFDAVHVGQRLDSGDISIVSLVPAMLDSVLDSRGESAFVPDLRAILLGGAACSERLLQRCRAGNLPVALSWGMTETASQVATRHPGDLGPLSEGIPPLPWVRVTADADGRLIVEGPAAHGKLVTDDLGEITSSGQVFVRGRQDDVIIRGGENIHPAEIEAVLESHPRVIEAVVLADEDRRLGQVPVAFVRSDNIDPDTMMRWCSDHLAGFKVPHEIEILAEFPRTGPGKVDRRKLRELRRNSP
ncbi:MAG: AMP-binding protein [Gammaproteobacteria bacterium]|nr:AMP-binding protein [Gammaproteobacteria bacterium]